MNESISFHEKAAESFDRRGLTLLEAVGPMEAKRNSDGFSPDLHPAFSLGPEDITHMRGGDIDPLTFEMLSMKFSTDDGLVGFGAEQCRELDRLAEAIQRTPTVRPRISPDFVRDRVLDWLESRNKGEVAVPLSMFMQRACEDALETQEVWIPLANLTIQRDLRIGSVRLRALSSAVLDEWYQALSEKHSEENREDLDSWFHEKRQKIQGLAACYVAVRSEFNFAVEKGLEKAEQISGLLRALHPANTAPTAAYYCRPLGSEGVKTFTAEVKSSGVYGFGRSSFRKPIPDRWDLGEERLAEIEARLTEAAPLLDPAHRSGFQTVVFDALMIYSRSTIATEATDKLVFMLVALESLLLKSASEPIQNSVGDRLAFFLGKDAEERRAIAALTRQCYGFRSAFIHHGKTLEDLERLKKFMMYVWVFFSRLMARHGSFETKEEFIDALESRKFS